MSNIRHLIVYLSAIYRDLDNALEGSKSSSSQTETSEKTKE